MFELRKSVDDLVHEFTVSFVDHTGAPAGHVCRVKHLPGGREQVCNHGGIDSRAPLLLRLQALVPEAGVKPPASDDAPGKSSRRAPAGSPAPWAAAPAELLDEVLRGAIDLQAQCREALGLSPHPAEDVREVVLGQQVIRSTLPLHMLGRRALRRLPGLVLELRRIDHPLAIRLLADGRVRAGGVEVGLRRWHSRSLELIGYEVPWQRLGPALNPDVEYARDRPGRAYLEDAGPVCAVPSCGHVLCGDVRAAEAIGWQRVGPVCVSCSHRSCARVRRSRQRYLPWWCPTCGADSLRVNPASRVVRCLRSACGDHDWTMEEIEDGTTDPWGDFDA